MSRVGLRYLALDESSPGSTAPRVASLLVLLFLMVGGSSLGCDGCFTDPCADVDCPRGMECWRGVCVPMTLPDDGCRSDEDCASVQGRTRCDAVSGSCVECLIAAHCPNPDRQICDAVELFCVSRPPCASNEDCADLPGTPRCLSTTGKCVTCLTDEHCSGRQQRCEPATGSCGFTACVSSQDCSSYEDAPHCQTQSGLCQECTNDGHCLEAEVCRDGVCIPEGECQRDVDCGIAQRCNTLSQACVQCVSSADCRLGGRCTSSKCGVAFYCESDADCGAPFRCSTSTAICRGCLHDDHCETGQICSNGLCRSGPTCGPGLFCGPSEECHDGSCVPFTCPDDGHGAGRAPYLGAAVASGTIAGLSLCPNAWHWFVMDASLGDGLLVRLDYEPVDDHPTLLAWAGTGTGAVSVAEPSLTESGQALEAPYLSRAGPIWVGVRGVNHHLIAKLHLDITPGGLCEDDEHEPNHLPELAAPMPSPVAGVTSVEAIACFGSDDWFQVPVPAGERVLAEAHVSDGGSNPLVVAIHERKADGTLHLLGGAGSSDAETDPLRAATNALIRVSNPIPDPVAYRLRVRLRPPLPANDECEGALPLVEGTPESGTTLGASSFTSSSCGSPGSTDAVYSFELSSRRSIRVTATGNLDTVLSLRSQCDLASSELLCADRPGDTEVLEAVLPAGEWFVWVEGYGGREGSFEILLETSDPPPPSGNDDCATAKDLDSLEGGGLEEGDVASASDIFSVSCGEAGRDSAYRLILDEPASLFAELHALAGMSLSLRETCEEDESEIACSVASEGGPALLDIPYLAAGEHTLVVDGGGVAGGAYTLSWGLGSATSPPLNDRCEDAWPLDLFEGVAEVHGDTLGASDAYQPICAAAGKSSPDVAYRFLLTSTRSVEVQLDASFDAVLELRGLDCDGPEEILVCSDSSPPSIFEPALPPGIYHLLVDGYAGGKGAFDLFLQTDDPLTPPVNDSCDEAEHIDRFSLPVTILGYTWLARDLLDPGTACTGSPTSGPDVVYSIDLDTGDTLVATVTPTDGYDPAIYLLASCDASSCLAGVDDYFVSEAETLTFTAVDSGRYYIVIDSWRAGEAGWFDLTVTIE